MKKLFVILALAGMTVGASASAINVMTGSHIVVVKGDDDKKKNKKKKKDCCANNQNGATCTHDGKGNCCKDKDKCQDKDMNKQQDDSKKDPK
ncbi:MAG TPA: hypothetical protein VFU15_16585 [Bacteroidia bacterium]|nr:hypothetical protein [Bacteroidia bacterium]